MSNELNLLGFRDTNLKQACIPSRADQHREIIQLENPDRVPISVKNVPCFFADGNTIGNTTSSYLAISESATRLAAFPPHLGNTQPAATYNAGPCAGDKHSTPSLSCSKTASTQPTTKLLNQLDR